MPAAPITLLISAVMLGLLGLAALDAGHHDQGGALLLQAALLAVCTLLAG